MALGLILTNGNMELGLRWGRLIDVVICQANTTVNQDIYRILKPSGIMSLHTVHTKNNSGRGS